MDNDPNLPQTIFSSKITRSNVSSKNNLTELLQIATATPISCTTVKQNICDYIPKSDKYYISKKKSGLKVKTVRDIRNVFEQDVYTYLSVELEKQQNILLRKIRHGCSGDARTREIAKNMLNSESPISKSAWHMLMNINPEEHCHPIQYILWNGKHIQVNGSKGGKNKFMSKYDVGKIVKNNARSTYISKENMHFVKKKSLLENSLDVKFKPGPLTRKKYLDTSYQKHQFGDMELVSLPKPGLEIQTGCGKPLGPTVTTFLHKTFMQDSNCFVSAKWAEFAVSVLGSNGIGNPSQPASSTNISFDLSYKCLQNRILMRHDSDIINNKVAIYNTTKIDSLKEDDSVLIYEIQSILSDLIQAVDISLNQDNMYTGEDEPREATNLDNNVNQNSQFKDKSKRKYCELDRLDVTVIRITDASDKSKIAPCKNASCAFGCVCSSLRCDYNFKGHCGRIKCMFKCECDISSYKINNCMEDCSDILPGLININKKVNVKLAREEKKFHQTVIVTNEKSILLKSRKRDWKTSKKYADFFTHMRLKPESNKIKELSVVALKLNCKNIVPWCMVHNLYKCFCKGKFTTTRMASIENTTVNEISNVSVFTTTVPDLLNTSQECQDNEIQCLNTNNDDTTIKRRLRHKTEQVQRKLSEKSLSDCVETDDISSKNLNTCARIEPYKGRKYYSSYYSETNLKVSEMEKNDKKLHSKLVTIMRNSEVMDCNDSQDSIELDTLCQVSSLRDLLTNVVEENMQCSSTDNTTFEEVLNNPSLASDKRLPYKTKIVSWLESCYKQYKLRECQGMVKCVLDPPKAGKMALYPWDFILSRYRERKNHFLISQQKPFRIFMAVDLKKKKFEKYINIRDIALCDLDQYPITVKNLLSNATNLIDNFCILYGLEYCWELVGSVTKVNESKNDNLLNAETKTLGENTSSIIISQAESSVCKNTQNSPNKLVKPDDSSNNISELSKWFLMTIENDFSEIQFYNKGFFVRYDSVIKAINVARASGKTVRLSVQKYDSQQNDTQFGIYAIPNHNSYCVFIGPYDKDEKLGIETVKTVVKFGNKRTRGIWITTNKVDNVKVIDNLLSFMDSANIGHEKMVPLESNAISTINAINPVSLNTEKINKCSKEQQKVKTIKPIKIRKTNDFYHLSSNGLLRQAPLTSCDKVKVKIVQPVVVNKPINKVNKMDLNTIKPPYSLLKATKPVAEIAPQIQIHNNKSLKKTPEGGMFILNPEEINKRLFEKACHENSSDSLMDIETTNSNTIINLDIEKFLATSVVRPAPNSDICIISDEEDEDPTSSYVDVYIVCQNIKNLGWIPGKRNSDSCLSFIFPGFKETEFYPENEAFEKITQVMSRKVYIPKWINLEWQVCESLTDISSKQKLESKDLQSDYVMTKQGLRHKNSVLNNINNCKSLMPAPSISTVVFSSDFLAQKDSLLEDLEATSSALENESEALLEETVLKRSEITESLVHASDDMREEFSETLTNMFWCVDDTEVILGDT